MALRSIYLAILSLLAVVVFAEAASAVERQNFDARAFAAAQAAGQSILVDVSAPWCPTCRAQKPILEKLAARPEFMGLMIFEVDFDTQKDVLRSLNARSQSTLIVFKGQTETGRSVGSTNSAAIESLLKTAL